MDGQKMEENWSRFGHGLRNDEEINEMLSQTEKKKTSFKEIRKTGFVLQMLINTECITMRQP